MGCDFHLAMFISSASESHNSGTLSPNSKSHPPNRTTFSVRPGYREVIFKTLGPSISFDKKQGVSSNDRQGL